jgi:hypothetical protein
MMQSPNSTAVSLCVQNSPIICQIKEVSSLGYYAMHYKHVHVFPWQTVGALKMHKRNGNKVRQILLISKDSV